MKVLLSFVVIVIAIHSVAAQFNLPANSTILEDGKLNFIDFAEEFGHTAEGFDVTTEDGYILKIFHIPGNKSRPVLLQHGLLGSADAFIIRGNTSLAIALAEEGYDVWVANSRGNRYSRRHETLSPDTDKQQFFNYSFPEFGMYDSTAYIDFILNKTGQSALSIIGHSEGTTMFFALGASRPEYNKKIKILAAMAPVCFFNHVRPPVLPLLVTFSPVINRALKALNQEELLGPQSLFREFLAQACSIPVIGYALCVELIFFPLVGYDSDQLEPAFTEKLFFKYYFAGTSRKNFYHLAQLGIRPTFFAQYDYSPMDNLAAYNSITPPEYDLSKVTMNISLIVGQNDKVATKEDADNLNERLPNVVDYHMLEPSAFNHIDFLVGRDTHKVMFPYIFDLLDTYN